MSLTNFERPTFRAAEISADARERGQILVEALGAMAHQLSHAGVTYDARLLNINFKTPSGIVVIPDHPISYQTMGWKAHKGLSVLTEVATTMNPVILKKLSVSPNREYNVTNWFDLRISGESEWRDSVAGADAHQIYETYTFPLNSVELAVIDSVPETS